MKLMAILAAMGVVTLANARVATITYLDLVKQSHVIVLAKVTRIDTVAGVKLATADVLRNVRGSQRTVQFVAERTWACDTSMAIIGETALLFLASSNGVFKHPPGSMVLSHAGRGRVPLQWSNGRYVAKVRKGSSERLWDLNVNLYAPRVQPIGVRGRDAYMTLDQLVRAAGGF